MQPFFRWGMDWEAEERISKGKQDDEKRIRRDTSGKKAAVAETVGGGGRGKRLRGILLNSWENHKKKNFFTYRSQ